jgi:POT family proton-dependent oligopeptide transporter
MRKAYGAFYWTINFGSFFSFIVIPWVHNKYGYSLAFGVPGILMAIATYIFWCGKKFYVFVPTASEKKHRGFAKVFFTTLFSKRATGKKFWEAAREMFSESEVSAARSVLPILFVFALIPMFWALYDQGNSTWVAQARKLSEVSLLGFQVNAENMQSLNPLLIMLFVPIFTWLIYPRIGRFASPLKRISFGLFLAAFSFVLVAHVQKNIEAGAHLTILAQVWQNIFLAAGEVLVSTTGLEFAFREAAPEMKSTIMSFWLVTVGIGNFLVVVLTKMLGGDGADAEGASVSTGRFMLYAEMMFGVAVVFSLIAAFYQYRDKAAAEGK